VSDRLFWGSPFAGYEEPYLERWMAAFGAAAEDTKAEALWYYNGRDPEFAELLRERAATMPIPVEVMHEHIPALGNTDPIRKNNAVTMGHARIQYELRKRDPGAYLFMHESDVIIPEGGIQRLRAGLEAHPALGALSAAVPDPRGLDPPHIGTMAWRIQPRHEGAYTVPGAGPVVDYYTPELHDGIEIVDAVPFGALFTRLAAFEKVPLAAVMFPGMGVDQEWSQNALYKGDMPVAINWGVWCGHLRNLFNPRFDDLRERITTAAPRKVGIA